MFFRDFDKYMTQLSKLLKQKKSVDEMAVLFDQLYQIHTNTNPFDNVLKAIAKFGELECYNKVDDYAGAVQIAVSAARLFISHAEFGYKNSYELKESWVGSLSDGLYCYRLAVKMLNTMRKYFLCSNILNEIGNVELKFDMTHSAGNTFEESVEVIINGDIPLPMLFNTLLSSVRCYIKVERYDLALNIIERAQKYFYKSGNQWLSPLPVMKDQYRLIELYQSLFYMILSKYDECIDFSEKNLSKVETELITELCEAAKNYQVFRFDSLIGKAKEKKLFEQSHIALLETFLNIMSKSVEQSIYLAISS